MNLRVKVIRSDNGIEFKNKKMNQFCEVKGIMSQYSVARTPQQNGVVEWRNKTLIEAARTMLANIKMPTTFWVEAVNTACYVQNRVLVTKPHNKTHYELFHGKTHAISFLKPFGCPVTILNTKDHLCKFDGKANEGLFVGYSLDTKAFRVFNSRSRNVEENLHVRFSENIPNNVGSGPNWLFVINALTKIMNYQPVVVQSNDFSGTQASNDAGKEKEPNRDYILIDEDLCKDNECNDQGKENNTNNTNRVNTVTSNINATSSSRVNVVGTNKSIDFTPNLNMPSLEDIGIFEDSHDDEDVFGAEADFYNLDSTFQVSPFPITRIHKDHPLEQVIGDLHSAHQTRRMLKNLEEHGTPSFKRSKLDRSHAGGASTVQTSKYRNPVKKILLKLNLSDHMSILTDSQVTPTKTGRMKKPYSSHRFIANCFNAGHLKMEVKIVDFLNANQIKYALTVSSAIYTSCIKQFSTVKIKSVNDDVQLQALIDGKKVFISEASIRHDLKLTDAERESLSLKHELISRTCFKNSLIMVSVFSSKSKSSMTMSIPPQDEPSINRPVVSFVTSKNLGLLEDLAHYDNERWNEPRDFAAISLPYDVPSRSDRRLIELKNQVQRLMDVHLAPKQHVQVNKITSSYEIYSGPHDTQYCMENLEQAFVDYASSHNNEVGGR
nr:retrovirus-related Pol polyprotein from transposon TNT 1-94 [Tanacetum cinerariifolium]